MSGATNLWNINMDKGLLNGAIFSDVKRPSILSIYDILCGVWGTPLTSFTYYLQDRSQIIKVSQVASERCAIQRGLPQGSNLETLLFLIYICINGLPRCL